MRSRLAAAAVLLLAVFSLIASRAGHAGERAPTQDVPVKEALEKMKKASAPKGALGAVRFYADVLDGKSVEFVMGDFTNAGLVDEGIVAALEKSRCGKLSGEKQKAADAVLAEYGEALPVELRGYLLGQQGKAEQAGPLLLKALETMQPLDRCVHGHPDDAGKHAARVNAWLTCVGVLAPKADQKKVKAIQTKAMQCMAATFGTVG